MNRILAVAMLVSFGAWAQAAKPAEKKESAPAAVAKPDQKDAGAAAAPPMTPPKPSAETLKLGKVFTGKKTWSGKMPADAMGPGSPEMTTKGTHDCRAVAEKFFYACDLDVTMTAGKQSNTWRGHFVTGWDGNANGYKAYLVDNLGMVVPMDGVITDTTYQVTSSQELPMMGMKMKARFTWDWSNPKQMKFTNEHSVNGGPWQVFETETIK